MPCCILGDTVVQCNLINMYGKCGALLDACAAIFDEIESAQRQKYESEIDA